MRDNFEGKENVLCSPNNISVLDATSQYFLILKFFNDKSVQLINWKLSLNNGGYQFKAHQGTFKC